MDYTELINQLIINQEVIIQNAKFIIVVISILLGIEMFDIIRKMFNTKL